MLKVYGIYVTEFSNVNSVCKKVCSINTCITDTCTSVCNTQCSNVCTTQCSNVCTSKCASVCSSVSCHGNCVIHS